MPRPPLLTLSNVRLSFGGRPLFEGVTFALSKGERAALVGRNGAGKSTLMKLMAGDQLPDEGDVWVQPGTTAAFVPQEPDFRAYATLLDYTAEGLDARHRAEAELTEMGLDPRSDPLKLSGGQKRRAALARGFALDPDLLMMDEPTNHLDVATIEWLEQRLMGFNGALLLVSHDRTFLETVSTCVLWLRGGEVLKSPSGYGEFDNWAEQVEAEEEKQLSRMSTQLKAEKRWLARGVTARRKRNQGRLAKLNELRQQHAELRSALTAGKADAALTSDSGDLVSKRVIEVKQLSKAFQTSDGPLQIVRDLSLNILKGDRIGIVGPNGAGKTSLVRLLLGELPPDDGFVKRAQNLDVTYLDQTRDNLRDKDTLWETLAPNGGDTIMVQGRARHVAGYAKDFLFDPQQLHQPVGALSGGERNRLSLAVGLASPTNLLVLDEPTNDLDMQTLDLLEDMLANYEGTLILVSHDRAFLDSIVTSCLVPTSRGQWLQTAGGWSDAVRQVPELGRTRTLKRQGKGDKKAGNTSPAPKPEKSQTKLSYKDAFRLKEIDKAIPDLEAEIARLETALADPDAYARDPAAFKARTERLASAKAELEGMEEEWLVLEEKREALGS